MGRLFGMREKDEQEVSNSSNDDTTMEKLQSKPEPKRGRLVVVGQEEVTGTEGTRITYHTEFKKDVLVMSDASAEAFLSYEGDPAVRKKLEEIVANARPDLVPKKNGVHK